MSQGRVSPPGALSPPAPPDLLSPAPPPAGPAYPAPGLALGTWGTNIQPAQEPPGPQGVSSHHRRTVPPPDAWVRTGRTCLCRPLWGNHTSKPLNKCKSFSSLGPRSQIAGKRTSTRSGETRGEFKRNHLFFPILTSLGKLVSFQNRRQVMATRKGNRPGWFWSVGQGLGPGPMTMCTGSPTGRLSWASTGSWGTPPTRPTFQTLRLEGAWGARGPAPVSPTAGHT